MSPGLLLATSAGASLLSLAGACRAPRGWLAALLTSLLLALADNREFGKAEELLLDLMAEPEQRREMEQDRTTAHNAFIDACNILNRQMAKSGESPHWRELLGADRKEIGDFACFVVLFVSLGSR